MAFVGEAQFAHLYETNYRLLFATAYKYMNSQQDAMDIVHELFLHIVQKPSLVETLSADEVRRYLYVAVRNRCLNQLAKNKREEPLDGNETDAHTRLDSCSVEDHLNKISDREEILKILNIMPRQYRDYLLMKYIYEYDPSRIADILQVQVQSLSMVQKRAKECFRKANERRSSPHGRE